MLRVQAIPIKKTYQEWLSYDFVNPQSEAVEVQLRWEETAVTFKIETNALTNSLAELNDKESKTTGDYQQMAIRTLELNSDDSEKALEYLETILSAARLPGKRVSPTIL